MNDIINLLIGLIFLYVFAVGMIFSTRELAFLILLHWRGKPVLAELESIKRGKANIPRRYLYNFSYVVNGRTYQFPVVRSVDLFLRKPRWEPELIDLLYLPCCPAISRSYGKPFMFARIGLAIIMTAAGFFCAFMLFEMTRTEWMFGLWLLLMGIFILFPKVGIHPMIGKLFWSDFPGERKSKNSG